MATDATDSASEIDSLRSGMDGLTASTNAFGRALSRALASGLTQGKSFDDILRTIGQRFIEIGLRAALRPLDTALSTGLNTLLGGVSFGAGAAGAPLSITPFAEGGVIGAPSFFPLGRNLGLAGERGAEAILPLARGPDGRLGVSAPGRAGAPVAVSVTINTPDAESFARAEAQVSAALARAVARGQRGL